MSQVTMTPHPLPKTNSRSAVSKHGSNTNQVPKHLLLPPQKKNSDKCLLQLCEICFLVFVCDFSGQISTRSDQKSLSNGFRGQNMSDTLVKHTHTQRTSPFKVIPLLKLSPEVAARNRNKHVEINHERGWYTFASTKNSI